MGRGTMAIFSKDTSEKVCCAIFISYDFDRSCAWRDFGGGDRG
jgi:hypothetical protein